MGAPLDPEKPAKQRQQSQPRKIQEVKHLVTGAPTSSTASTTAATTTAPSTTSSAAAVAGHLGEAGVDLLLGLGKYGNEVTSLLRVWVKC
jgi:hypothetical protein